MTFPPLCFANLVVNETSSINSVTVSRRGRGRVLTAQGQGRRQKLSPKLPGFGRPARPRNTSETPKEDLSKRWSRSASTTAARTKFRGFQHSPWEYGTDQRRPGLPTRSQCREFLRELQKAPHRANFFSSPLAWVFGSGIICPETNAPQWVQRAGFGQPFIASAQR